MSSHSWAYVCRVCKSDSCVYVSHVIHVCMCLVSFMCVCVSSDSCVYVSQIICLMYACVDLLGKKNYAPRITKIDNTQRTLNEEAQRAR